MNVPIFVDIKLITWKVNRQQEQREHQDVIVKVKDERSVRIRNIVGRHNRSVHCIGLAKPYIHPVPN